MQHWKDKNHLQRTSLITPNVLWLNKLLIKIDLAFSSSNERLTFETNAFFSCILLNKCYLKCVFIFLLKKYQQDAQMNLDRFLVYGELYRELRDSIARAMLSNDTDELAASLEVT